jgi:hypothetical protein
VHLKVGSVIGAFEDQVEFVHFKRSGGWAGSPPRAPAPDLPASTTRLARVQEAS